MQVRIGTWLEIEVGSLRRGYALGVYIRAGHRDWWAVIG